MSSERTQLDEALITRRHVLEAFGVLGGSSLVMGTMDAWGLMGAAAAQRPVFRGRVASAQRRHKRAGLLRRAGRASGNLRRRNRRQLFLVPHTNVCTILK